jgi:hypothetical protein
MCRTIAAVIAVPDAVEVELEVVDFADEVVVVTEAAGFTMVEVEPCVDVRAYIGATAFSTTSA